MRKRIIGVFLSIMILICAGTAAAEEDKYRDLNMTLMLPSLDIEAEIVLAPWEGDNWDVYGLKDRAGLLEGGALPGEGYTILAGHNHLSATETGPFLLIRDMKIGDVIFVADEDGMKRFTIYANELLDAAGGDRLAEIARTEPSALVLLTCENETPEGTYANRRAVFARPAW